VAGSGDAVSSQSWVSLVEEYLSIRRGLGFALTTPAWLLRDFARYAEVVDHQGPLTTELAVRWAQESRSGSGAQAIRRVSAVRQFALHRALLDPGTEVPPPGVLGRLPGRPQPHIYSDTELAEYAGLSWPHCDGRNASQRRNSDARIVAGGAPSRWGQRKSSFSTGGAA